MALIATVLGAGWLVALVLVSVLLARPPSPVARAAHDAETPERAYVDDLRVGQCLGDDAGGPDVLRVRVLPCSRPHAAEVFDLQTLPGHPHYPGGDEVVDEAESGCEHRFQAYVGGPYEDSDLDVTTYTPTKQGWEDGDRSVICVLTGTDLVGSSQNTAGTDGTGTVPS